MRLLTFVAPDSGKLHVGALTRDARRVVDLTAIGLDDMFMAVERAANLARIASHLVENEGAVGHAIDQVRIVAPMPGARCVHLGLPSASPRTLAVVDDEPPLAFTDPGPLLGPADTITARAGDRWALAIAAVLAAGGRDISEDHALRCIAGYTMAGRWLGDAANADGSPAVQLGPWLVSPDDAGNVGTARDARVLVNDAVVAAGRWDVGAPFARLVARASRQFELRPGDVFTALLPATGGGPCAASVVAGQKVRLEVDGLGALPVNVV
jgi:2-keto-4-pentenoate hydratase/2-oxohepta-3-ene-1,7-dioic acid hydratase in catechol pathway